MSYWLFAWRLPDMTIGGGERRAAMMGIDKAHKSASN